VKIIRFGSAAWGTLHEHSDLDLCVVVERTDERHIRDIRRALNRLLWEQCGPGDVEIQLHVIQIRSGSVWPLLEKRLIMP
jgi:predicted nucleotidyltransferase